MLKKTDDQSLSKMAIRQESLYKSKPPASHQTWEVLNFASAVLKTRRDLLAKRERQRMKTNRIDARCWECGLSMEFCWGASPDGKILLKADGAKLCVEEWILAMQRNFNYCLLLDGSSIEVLSTEFALYIQDFSA